MDIQTFKFPGKGSPDFAIQVGINGYHTVILVPPSCSNIVPPFHNLTKAPICVVIKTLKWRVLSKQEMIIMHTFKWVILADVWWGIAFCAQNLFHKEKKNGKKKMVCSSHSGQLIAPSSNLIPLLIWLSFLPILFYYLGFLENSSHWEEAWYVFTN